MKVSTPFKTMDSNIFLEFEILLKRPNDDFYLHSGVFDRLFENIYKGKQTEELD